MVTFFVNVHVLNEYSFGLFYSRFYYWSHLRRAVLYMKDFISDSFVVIMVNML